MLQAQTIDNQWTQTLKFTESTGNEQSGHTEGLKNVKDYPRKTRKKPAKTVQITQILKNRRFDFPDFRGWAAKR